MEVVLVLALLVVEHVCVVALAEVHVGDARDPLRAALPVRCSCAARLAVALAGSVGGHALLDSSSPSDGRLLDRHVDLGVPCSSCLRLPSRRLLRCRVRALRCHDVEWLKVLLLLWLLLRYWRHQNLAGIFLKLLAAALLWLRILHTHHHQGLAVVRT